MWRLLPILLCLVGCKKKAPESAGESLGLGGDGRTEIPRVEVVGPVHWWDATGLCLDVPDGWTGLGKGDRGRLLSLAEPETGIALEILLGDAPPERSDMVRVFADAGTYRDIPALGATGVESWISDVPGGPALQVWTAEVRGTPVRLEARYPHGASFTGMGVVERLLAAVCVE